MVITELDGMGKSSLAWQWLHSDLRRTGADSRAWVNSGQEPQAVLWYSFYEPGANFSSFLQIAHCYLGGQLTAITPTVESVATDMTRLRGIFVLDGFERQLLGFSNLDQPHREENAEDSIRFCADGRVAKFLETVASIPGKGSKILITSRLMPVELEALAGVHDLRLPGLSDDEAVEFLEREVLGIDRELVVKIATTYSAHPLALRLAAGLLNDPSCNYLAVAEDADLVLNGLIQREHHVLEAAFEALGEPDKAFLSTISAFRGATSFDAARAVLSGGDSPTFWLQVKRLVDRGFLWTNRNDRTFDLHPIVRLYVYSRLTDKASVADRIRHVYEAIPRPVALTSVDQAEPVFEICYQYARAARFNEAWDLFSTALWMDVGVKLGEDNAILQIISLFFPNGWSGDIPVSGPRQPMLISRAAQTLRRKDRHRDVISLLESRTSNSKDESNIDALRCLGHALFCIGNFSEGVAVVQRALELSEDRHTQGHVYRELIYIFDKLEMRVQAHHHLNRMKSCYKQAGMLDARHLFEAKLAEYDLCKALRIKQNRLTELEDAARALDWEQALQLWRSRRANFLVKRLDNVGRTPIIYQWLFGIKPENGDETVAEGLIEELLLDARNADDVAEESWLLSLSARLAKKSDATRARATAVEAVRLARRTEGIFPILHALRVLADVESSNGNLDGQAESLREALQLVPNDDIASSLRNRIQNEIRHRTEG
jgi:tetratricopeptide (TPR) repeat protein